MLARCPHVILFVTVSLQMVSAQTPSRTAAFGWLAQPRVPDDPLELITGDAQPAQDAGQRATAVNLLERAHKLSYVRPQRPYHFKTTFTVTGTPSSDGIWTMEDIAPAAGLFRWTAQGSSYSVVNLYTGNILYSSQPTGALPLRLAQVREALFYHHEAIGTHTSVRTGTASLNGSSLNCVLIARNTRRKPSASGRLWDEAEYCVDAQSGLLVTWSPAPGVYVLYDNSNALSVDGKLIPSGFTITEAGQTIVTARVESVTDSGSADASLFDRSGLSQTGSGAIMQDPWRVAAFVPYPDASANLALQEVVVHGMRTPGGALTETEVVASTSASLNQSALDLAAKGQGWRGMDEEQPGATPQVREFFFTVRFAVPTT